MNHDHGTVMLMGIILLTSLSFSTSWLGKWRTPTLRKSWKRL